MPERTNRRAPRRNFAGLLVTLVLHGAVLGAVRYAHSQTPPPLEIPRDFVVAKLVKLGKPREKFWLPRVVEPPTPQAPPPVLKVSENPNAVKAPPEAPRPDNPQISKNLRRALDRARKLEALADPEPDEGQLNGSERGTANEASAGDEYATAIFEAIRRNWTEPSGLVSDAELARLTAEIRIRVGADGTITDSRLLHPSGNSYFDDSCTAAITATRKVPPPPPAVRKLAARGFAIDFAGKDIK
ncbi:MAG TPA: energy transducer TonB [Polyangia bacterium]|nr:energy transducer TonB [Polyangia bacterium]